MVTFLFNNKKTGTISLVAAVVGFLALTVYTKRRLTPKASVVTYTNRQALPSLKQLLLLFLLGAKTAKLGDKKSVVEGENKKKRIGSTTPAGAIVHFAVEHFAITSEELKTLRSILVGSRPSLKTVATTTNSEENDTSLDDNRFDLVDATLVPHIFLQPLMLTAFTHADFPVSLVGAVHLRSTFHVHDAQAVLDAVRSGGGEKHRYSAQCDYLGMRPVMKPVKDDNSKKRAAMKGIEVFIVLRLVDKLLANNTDTQKVIWEEVVVLFSARSSMDAAILDAHRVDDGCFRHNDDDEEQQQSTPSPLLVDVDFTNLPQGSERCQAYLESKKEASHPSSSPSSSSSSSSSSCGVQEQHVSGHETSRYGVLSNDMNPIHMSSLGALALGQKGRIAHGVLVLAKLFCNQQQQDEAKTTATPAAFSFGVAFKGPIPVDSTVIAIKKEEERASIKDSVESMDTFCKQSTKRPAIVVRVL